MWVSRPGLGLKTDQDHFFEVLVLVSTLLVLVLVSACLVLVSDSLVLITSLPKLTTMHSSNSAHLCVMLNSSLVMYLRNVKQKKNTYATQQQQQLSIEILGQ